MVRNLSLSGAKTCHGTHKLIGTQNRRTEQFTSIIIKEVSRQHFSFIPTQKFQRYHVSSKKGIK